MGIFSRFFICCRRQIFGPKRLKIRHHVHHKETISSNLVHTLPVSETKRTGEVPSRGSNKRTPVQKPAPNGNLRNRRLMKEFQSICCYVSNFDTCDKPFAVSLVDDNLSEWNIDLYHFDHDSKIWRDMKENCISRIRLNAVFPQNFPFEPPFIRVVSPLVERGYVMSGGAICLELLTRDGWSSGYLMEAVIVQLAASFVKGGARLKFESDLLDDFRMGGPEEFTRSLAEESFKSLVKTHKKFGWRDPPKSEG